MSNDAPATDLSKILSEADYKDLDASFERIVREHARENDREKTERDPYDGHPDGMGT